MYKGRREEGGRSDKKMRMENESGKGQRVREDYMTVDLMPLKCRYVYHTPRQLCIAKLENFSCKI